MSQPLNSTLLIRVRPKFYLDSVALMRHSKILAQLEGVDEAAMMMGTPANQAIMQNAGLLEAADTQADGGDLIISIRGSDSNALDAAMLQAEQLLDQPKKIAGSQQFQPRSIGGASRHMPGANLVLVSVPGEFAISEARKAIQAGMHVMIFSDNVPLAAEAELKREAQSLGRLVMGPDCGTSIVNGVPLAFANKIRSGDIGIVGASGTGIQEVCCLLDHAGRGISHAIGVGGRDLYAEVGGVSTLMALAALEADARTRHIVVISKPPAAPVAEKILEAVGRSQKTFTICFIGNQDKSLAVPGNARLAVTLKETAEAAADALLMEKSIDVGKLPRRVESRQRIVGLYTGGTLCAEAQLILSAHALVPASNVPIPGATGLDNNAAVHRLVDLGADEYTRGRPHPMIEPSVRDQALLDTLAEPDVAVIVLDVVLGFGSHADPAGHIQRLLDSSSAPAKANRPLLVASVTGTEADPQVRSRQVEALVAAGIVVVNANADAVHLALAYLSGVQSGSQSGSKSGSRG